MINVQKSFDFDDYFYKNIYILNEDIFELIVQKKFIEKIKNKFN